VAVFFYTYKNSAGERLEGEIDAPGRDAAFSALRAQGIRPIKVVAKDGTRANGAAVAGGVQRRVLIVGMLAAALVAGVVAFWGGKQTADESDITVNTANGPVTSSVATPLARQHIPGDRARLLNLPTNLFANVAEYHLARYAEPGRMVKDATEVSAAELEASFRSALGKPIRVLTSDFTEYIDLKRIVTGMKNELANFLRDGGTVEEYLGELKKRQRLEASYREKAEKHLEELLKTPEKAYAYWLKANAQLKGMGIWELPLPDALRAQQAALDLDE